MINRLRSTVLLLLASALMITGGCSSGASQSTALNSENINLIFVITPDLANDPLGDIHPNTANLNNQGLQRSLLMATYLKQQLLGSNNVTGIYTLEPMTHLQTSNNYPDMVPIGFIQQFALLNRITVDGTTANSYPLYAAYGGPGDVPSGVVPPLSYIPGAQGLAFSNLSSNLSLVSRIVRAKTPGFHVFSAPWETTRDLLAGINARMGYDLTLPVAYTGTNLVFALSVSPSGTASLAAFDSKLSPPSSYPVLPAPVAAASCTQQNYFSYKRTAGVNGVVIPAGANTNQTVYLIRHAEAHPSSSFEDGNFVGAGQWRALSLSGFLAGALRGQPSPTMVYSIDPAQSFTSNNLSVSYVRPSMTVLPYAIANSLPYHLVSSFNLQGSLPDDPDVAKATSDFFFTGGTLSNQTVLVAWEHKHFPPMIKYLLDSYRGTVPAPQLSWPSGDYDTIWTVALDAIGNVTVHNALCEGIDSVALPATAPLF